MKFAVETECLYIVDAKNEDEAKKIVENKHKRPKPFVEDIVDVNEIKDNQLVKGYL